MNRAVFTIVAANYLPLARNLLNSYREYNQQDACFIVVVDGEKYLEICKKETFPLLFPDELGLNDFKSMAFRYDVVEFSTAVKPNCIKVLFDRGFEQVAYLDPDMMCFGSFGEMWSVLERATALIVPHVLSSRPGGLLDDVAFLNNGTYNLGFFAIQRNEEARELLRWWAEKLECHCFLDYRKGLATDQKWVNLMPALFEGVQVFRNPSWDVAFWNFHERDLAVRDERFFVAGGEPLILFHFSGFDFRRPEFVTRGLDLRTSMNETVQALFKLYLEGILGQGIADTIRTPYGFSSFDNGAPIHPFQRQIFHSMGKKASMEGSPFSVGGKGSFYGWLSRKRLLVAKKGDTVHDPRINPARGGNSRLVVLYMKAFYFACRLLGVTRTLSLMRVLNWLSDSENAAVSMKKDINVK